MSAITAKASRKMKKYAVLTREPRCFLGSFDFSWEQRKFGEVFDCTVPNNTLSRAELSYDEGTVLNVHYGDVLIKYGSVLDVQKDDIPRIPHRCREDFSGALLQDGDIIIADTAEDETTGKACEISNLQGSVIVSGLHTMVCRPRNRMALGYLGYYLNSNAYHHQLLPLMQGIKVLSLSRSNIQKTSVSYPTAVKEQQHIAYYFSQLDNLITLHQRKCALLFSPFQAPISMMFTTSTFSWEQRKLGEIGSVSMCRRIFKEQTSETGDIPFYKIGTFGAEPDAFISRELFEEYKSKYPYPKKGDILISASGSIGRTVEFAGNNEYFQDSNIVWLSHDERLSNSFLKCFYSVVKWAGIEGSTIKRLYNDNILNTVICMPSVPEQEHIGLFFENLDNLITLHQRQPFLHSTPEISLTVQLIHPFYTSSWEQRKFSDITFPAGEKNRDNLPLESYSITNEHGFVPQDEKFENGGTMREADKRMYYIVSPNSFAYNPARINVGSIGYQNIGKNVIVSSLYEVFKTSEDVDDRLLWHWFKSPDFQKLIMQLQEGGVRLYFYYDKLCMGEVSLPSLEEQRKIGKLFDTLDNLITLHQRKGKAAVTGCSNDANNSKGVYCKARDFGYKCYKKVKSQQIRCLIAVFIFFV